MNIVCHLKHAKRKNIIVAWVSFMKKKFGRCYMTSIFNNGIYNFQWLNRDLDKFYLLVNIILTTRLVGIKDPYVPGWFI